MQTDLQLIQAIKNGNAQAFSEFVLRFQNYVYTVSFSIVKNKPEAQEVTQDTFIKAHRAIEKFEANSKVSSWLYKIAYRTGLDMLRKRKNNLDLDIVSYSLADKGQNMADKLENLEHKALVEVAIDQLPAKEAVVLKLFYLEEMNVNEVVEITSMTKSNVKVVLFRARKKLAEIISNDFADLKNYYNIKS